MSMVHLLLTLAALAPLHAQLGPGCPVQPKTLRAMRDCFRPLLVFAPAARDASLGAQQALLEEYADDMMDRNLLYVPVLGHSGHFAAPLDAPFVLLKQAEMDAIRDRFKIGPREFAVVLIGRDGGEKFRWRKPVSVLQLDDLVDAMPMGRQEKAARAGAPR